MPRLVSLNFAEKENQVIANQLPCSSQQFPAAILPNLESAVERRLRAHNGLLKQSSRKVNQAGAHLALTLLQLLPWVPVNTTEVPSPSGSGGGGERGGHRSSRTKLQKTKPGSLLHMTSFTNNSMVPS